MRAPVLKKPVERFVDDLAPALAKVAAGVAGTSEEQARRDTVLEAFNLVAACIDADGRHTEGELWELIQVFAPLLDTELAGATPNDARKAGLVDAKAMYIDEPSVLFDILVRADARNGTAYARTYYDRALEIAFAVGSIDEHVATSELAAIEHFRGALLRHIAEAGLRGPGGRPPVTTPATATAGVATPAAPPEPEAPPRPIEELLAELDALVGMDEVKREVRLVSDLIRIEKLRHERGLPVLDQSRHLVFTGNPGTGKTTVARLLAQIYRTLGVVDRGHLVETDRSQLVAGYVGQTAIQVRAVFDQADQGVLLIDEAYSLVRGGERDFGREAIDTIVKLVEDRRDSVVVIVAGYPEEMREFVDVNPGLRSRFPRTIYFPDYSTDELVRIFELLGSKGRYVLDDAARERLWCWFDAQPRTKGFGNGRLARNLFEETVARQSSRLVQLEDPTDEQLSTFTADDIPEPAVVPPASV